MQSHPQRLDLIRVKLDVGSELGLDELRVRRGHTVPANGVKECGEVPRVVEPSGRKICPTLLGENLAVNFVAPIDIEQLALRIVVRACKPYERGIPFVPRFHLFDKPPSGPNVNDLARFWQTGLNCFG